MRKISPALCLALVIILWLTGCGGGGSPPPTIAAPTGLTATGSMTGIALFWVESSSAPDGYDVFRSVDDITYTKINSSLVTDVNYSDPMTSPTNNGVVYYYKVAAVKGNRSSAYSNMAKNIYGLRLSTPYITGCNLPAGGPYVIEGTVLVDGGNLTVGSGVELYMVDDAVLDIEQNYSLIINGLFHITATKTHPATLTSHHVGGALVDLEGFKIQINDSAVDYVPATSAGTLIQNATLNNLAGGYSIDVKAAAPRLYNLKAISNCSSGGSYVNLEAGCGALIEHCSFAKIALQVNGILDAACKLEYNRFRDGYYGIAFMDFTGPGITAGQIANNDFHGSPKVAYRYDMAGTSNIPLENNYWYGGIPPISSGGTNTITFNFTPDLSSVPSGVGPDW